MANQIATNGRHSSDMLTISDVARLLHVHQNSVRRWANAGLLRCYRVGIRGDRRFKADEVNQFLESAVEHEPIVRSYPRLRRA